MEVAVEPLKAVSEKAPFGKGTETVQDDTVRKAWQMDAAQVTLGGGEAWNETLQSIVDGACHDLGFSTRRIQQLGIHANLYKLLLYETGGHFTPHQDTEKEDGMFGTLVIQLPSLFTGGELSVWHNGETKTFDLASQCDEQFKRIAFYTDCQHQLHPITSGVRVCLVFNLVATTLKKDYTMEGQKPNSALETSEAEKVFMPSHHVNIETVHQLRSIAVDWKESKNHAEKLGYRLGHQYTPQSVAFVAMKGRDSILVQTLLDATSSDGRPLFKVHLLLMERYVKKYIDMGGPEISKDEVRARIVLNQNGVVCKADYGRSGPNDLWTPSNCWRTDKEDDDDDDVGDEKELDEEDKNIENWDMFLRNDGWMKQDGWVATEKEQKGSEDEEDEYDEDYDDGYDEGNPSRWEHKMFSGMNKEFVEPHQGNCAGSVEQWYYASAVVISLAKD
jgi:2OG-Fe(II) oxygenase superfamily